MTVRRYFMLVRPAARTRPLADRSRELADQDHVVEVGVQQLLAHHPREARLVQRAELLSDLVDRAGDPLRDQRGEVRVGLRLLAVVPGQQPRAVAQLGTCLLYTSPSPRDRS